MDIPPRPEHSPGGNAAASQSSSFLAAVRHRLGGSSFALPTLATAAEHQAASSGLPLANSVDDASGDDEDDAEELLWDAQKAVIAHNYPLATSFYTRALHLSSGPLPAAALALGNLLAASSPSSSAPPLRAMDGSYGSKIKARREWESLNRAGACYLVGAAQEWKNLEQAAAVPGDAKGKGKEREDSFEKDVSSDGCRGPSRREAALSSLHELLSHLLSLYRRGLVQCSDPPVPLPVTTAPGALAAILEEPDSHINVWTLGERFCKPLLSSALLEFGADGEDQKERNIRTSVSMHLHYLLALTKHTTSPSDSLSHFRSLLALSPSHIQQGDDLCISALKRADILETRIAAKEARAAERGVEAKAAATPYKFSPGPGKEAFSAFPFPKQLTSMPSPTIATTTSLADSFTSASSSALPPTPTTSYHLVSSPVARPRPLTRRTSNFSNATFASITSLSPSLFSLRLQNSPRTVLPSELDAEPVLAEMTPFSRAKSWFGSGNARAGSAEGTLRRVKGMDQRAMTLRSPMGGERAPLLSSGGTGGGAAQPRGSRPGKDRARIQSMFDPPISANLSPASPPPVPSPSTTRRPSFSPRTSSTLPPTLSLPASSSSAPVTPSVARSSTPYSPFALSNLPEHPSSSAQGTSAAPHLLQFGDKSLDPQLAHLEMTSKMTRGARCSICNREGVNFPGCPRCGLTFCGRECRVGELGAGDGKKHVCGALEARRGSSSGGVPTPGVVSRSSTSSAAAGGGVGSPVGQQRPSPIAV